MANLDVYSSIKGVKSIDDVVTYFLDTLLMTNRRWEFYVNWDKVRKLVEHYRIELGILEAGLDVSDKEFLRILKKYPEIIKLFPRLMAVRDDKFLVLQDLHKKIFSEFDFKQIPKTEQDFRKYHAFWKDSGLKDILQDVKNLRDYLLGVEVGSDTNARKNRGGMEWETLVEPLIRNIAKKHKFELVVRGKFEKLAKKLGINKVPRDLSRNMDFILHKDNKFIDIEANYFSGPGTKLEVPGAYVNREFKEGFKLSFILLTDGLGWQVTQDRLKDYFDKFPCVSNYQMAKDGVLEKAIVKHLS